MARPVSRHDCRSEGSPGPLEAASPHHTGQSLPCALECKFDLSTDPVRADGGGMIDQIVILREYWVGSRYSALTLLPQFRSYRCGGIQG